jgi:hypothetical protein
MIDINDVYVVQKDSDNWEIDKNTFYVDIPSRNKYIYHDNNLYLSLSYIIIPHGWLHKCELIDISDQLTPEDMLYLSLKQ